MTTTDPTFDAFERRLAATLTAEAETVAEPEDGLALVRVRIAHRRRARRAAWLAAAATLVLVAGTVGILLRSASTDSAPYVDTQLPPTAPAATVSVTQPPLVAPGPPEPWSRTDMAPTSGRYQLQVVDRQRRRWTLGVSAGELPDPHEGFFPVDVGGTMVWIDQLAGNKTSALWAPAPGTVAVLGSPAGLGYSAEVEADIVDLVTRMQVWDGETARRLAVDRTSGVLLTLGLDRTAVDEVDWYQGGLRADGALVLLLAPGHQWGEVLLTVRPASTGLSGTGSPVEVRGTTGQVREPTGQLYEGRPEDRSWPGPQIAWIEGDHVYELTVATSMTVDDAVALAGLLRSPDADELEQLLFPTWRPADLGSSAPGTSTGTGTDPTSGA